METPLEIDVFELKRRLDAKEPLVVLDVRNPNEVEICRLEGSVLIPLSELPNRFGELDKNREIVVHCRSGGRSLNATHFLRQNGYENVSNLKGGILAWSDHIDPTVTKY
jgi:adenylyltransferase/sulfurtransferase